MTQAGTQDSDYVIVDQEKRLSESIIWRMLENFYDTASISAWNQIPFYPTSNPFIAEAYAELIVSFLKDYRQHFNRNEPVYIIEMASGSGCFSFYLLQDLQAKLSYFDDLRAIPIKYVMTDFTDNNVRTWQANPALQTFVQSGLLEFAVFRPDSDQEIETRPSGMKIEPGSVHNPIIAIANYFFDSIKQDAFQIQGGALKEVRNTFSCPSDKVPAEGYPRFDSLVKTETCHEAPEGYYSDEMLNKLLGRYLEKFSDASVLIPLGAFDCLRNLRAMSGDNLVLISSDKGFTDENYMKGCREQTFLTHHGIFSYSVNYDAIKKYFELAGGCGFTTTDDNLSVSTAANYLLKQPVKLEESRYYFQEKVDKQNLANYLYFLQDMLTSLKPEKANEILRACLGYIQLSNFCPIVFCLAAPRIYAAIETINYYQQQKLLQLMPKVKAKFYSVQQQFDVFYWIGRMYYGLDMYEQALEAFRESHDVFGRSSSSLYYIAACNEVKGKYDLALRHYEETLELEPDCQYTKAGIERVKAKLVQVNLS